MANVSLKETLLITLAIELEKQEHIEPTEIGSVHQNKSVYTFDLGEGWDV